MAEVAIVISVNKNPQIYRHGPLGTFIVPPKTEKGIGMLIIREMGEIQDMGSNQTRRSEPIPAKKLALDLIKSFSILNGKGEQLGLLLCAADPDVPKALARAEQEERDYLAVNPGKLEQEKNPVTKVLELSKSFHPKVEDQKIKLSEAVQRERLKFEAECRKLVTAEEIRTAETNLTSYYQRLCRDADRMWSIESERREINLQHQEAAAELHYEKPWASSPQAHQDCPACGMAVKREVAICSHCNAVLDDEKAKKFKVGPYAPQFAQAAK